jgi:opacity protein-like surface antigen
MVETGFAVLWHYFNAPDRLLEKPRPLTTSAPSSTNHIPTDSGESIEAPLRNSQQGKNKMRSYLLSGACAASMLLALTPAAQAADIVDVPPEPMGWSWYVSVFGGWSIPKDEDIFVETTALTNYLDAEIELDDGFMVGAAFGAQINEWLRGEVEVSGHFHDAEGDAYVFNGTPLYYNVDGDEDALFVLANLWIDLPIGDMFRPYIGGGIGFGRIDVDVELRPTTPGTTYALIDDSDWGFAYQLGGGVAVGISENLALDVGYRYKVINNADLEVEGDIETLLGNTLDDDEIEKDYKSHNILVGLRLMF